MTSSYLRYSNACAQALRRCLKKEYRLQALKSEETTLKVSAWQDGKASAKRKCIRIVPAILSERSFCYKCLFLHDILYI